MTRSRCTEGLPIRIFIFTPFIALVLLMVGGTATVALRSADDDAERLATKLHEQLSANLRMRLDDYLAQSPLPMDARHKDTFVALLRSQAAGTDGRAFILDSAGAVVASSASVRRPSGGECDRGPEPAGCPEHVHSREGVPLRPRDGEAALAGHVADLRNDVSRRQRRPSLDSGHGHASSVLYGGPADGEQSFRDGVRGGAGALPRPGRRAGVDGDRAAPARGAR